MMRPLTTCSDERRNAGKIIDTSRRTDSSFAPRSLVVWIWLCAGLNAAGWALSAIERLNAVAYVVVLLIADAAFWLWLHFDKAERSAAELLRRWVRRFKRPFPLAFLLLAAMAFLGGAIYPPTNYDGLAYRLTRVLHWLAAGQWHWIHTDFPRLNNRGCGMEWLSAPIIAIFKTDRFLFVLNFIPFLFLPGLTFAVLTRLGVRRRAAWHWMWVAPTGYCFLLQAGSISNDAFGAPFALAAVYFALLARESGRCRDFFCSILSAALLTGAKASNLPLLLPCAIAILPALKIVLRRPIASAAVCTLGIFASFLPTAALNQYFCHDWTGLLLESDQTHGSMPIRLVANNILVAVENLAPPAFPEADRWNRLEQKLMPAQWNTELQNAFTERGAAEFHVDQMQIEENAGFGFGATLLLVASTLVAAVSRPRLFFNLHFGSFDGLYRAGIVFAPWISALALLSQSEVYAIGRIMAPCYILMLPLLLAAPCQAQLVKRTWWRTAAFVVFAIAAGLLFISPARPLFPVKVFLAKIRAHHLNSKLAARVDEVYSVYDNRNHAFAPALAALPADVKVLGLVTYDDPEATLWKPYGSRRIICVRPADTASYLKSKGVKYILARSDLFGTRFPQFDEWAKKLNAAIIRKIPLNIRAEEGPVTWYLVALK